MNWKLTYKASVKFEMRPQRGIASEEGIKVLVLF